MNILVLQGPNLNLLGEREPDIYGSTKLAEIHAELRKRAANNKLAIHQSNTEGKLINYIHEYRKWADGLIINPGAFTHYSYALRDAVAAFMKPVIEVHLSDITKREEFRKKRVFEELPNVSTIMGKGADGYYEALAQLTS